MKPIMRHNWVNEMKHECPVCGYVGQSAYELSGHLFKVHGRRFALETDFLAEAITGSAPKLSWTLIPGKRNQARQPKKYTGPSSHGGPQAEPTRLRQRREQRPVDAAVIVVSGGEEDGP